MVLESIHRRLKIKVAMILLILIEKEVIKQSIVLGEIAVNVEMYGLLFMEIT